MKVMREWFIQVPWGKIALISWGNPQGKKILLVHGRQDSAATFIPLLELLPDDYYYVGCDLPGHGRSDAFPIGIALTRFSLVAVIDLVLKELGWTEFCFVGHSMGAELGLFYNAIYPRRVKKIILLDASPALQRLFINNYHHFYSMYTEYYDNYQKYNVDDRVYTKHQAIQAVMKARDMSEDQAEIILSRNLNKIEDDRYRLSWDKRTKILIPSNWPPECYYELFSKAPSTLYIIANQSTGGYNKGKKLANDLISKLESNVKHFIVLRVDGTHDVHFIHPERFSRQMCSFLNKEFDEIKSKL